MMQRTHSSVRRLLFIGNLSIFMIGLGFAVRAKIAAPLQADIFDKIDQASSVSLVGDALGYTFLGFAFTLLIGSALVDRWGCKRVMAFSAMGFIVGSGLIALASLIDPGESAKNAVLVGLFLTGLGWGAVEAASNPMVAALDPNNKVHRLNVLHAWWPAGIVVGGLLGIVFTKLAWPWQVNLLILALPSVLLLALVLSSTFPPTERVARGISYPEMFQELFKQPLFYVFWVCMWFTAISELAPGQWVDLALSKVVGFDGILLLVYVSVLMFVMRHFAGVLSSFLPSVGILCLGCVFASVGLFVLSSASSPLVAFAAASLWGIGVCYMWPTMLASVSERFPRGGALFLGLMGFAGGMAIDLVLPRLGAIFDAAKLDAAGGLEVFQQLAGSELDAVLKIAASESFQAISLAPALLIPVFAAIWWWDARAKR